MSRIRIKVEKECDPPVTMLHEAKSGSVFFFKSAYDRFGRQAEPHMRLYHEVRNDWNEVDKAKIACVSLSDGAFLTRHRTTEILQVSTDLYIGAVHGAEK